MSYSWTRPPHQVGLWGVSCDAWSSHPITGRGIGYKLFAAGLIGGMNEMNVVYRALKIAREEGEIPWQWVIDREPAPLC